LSVVPVDNDEDAEYDEEEYEDAAAEGMYQLYRLVTWSC